MENLKDKLGGQFDSKSLVSAALTYLHTILGLAVNSYLLYAWHQYGGARCSTMLATWLFVMAASGLAMTVLAFGLVLYKKRRLRWYKQLLIAGEREPPVSIIFTLLENLAMNVLFFGSFFILAWLVFGNLLVYRTAPDQCPVEIIQVSKYYVTAYYFTIALAVLNAVRRHVAANGLPCFY